MPVVRGGQDDFAHLLPIVFDGGAIMADHFAFGHGHPQPDFANGVEAVRRGWWRHLFTRWKSLVVGKPFCRKVLPTPLPKTFAADAAHRLFTGSFLLKTDNQ